MFRRCPQLLKELGIQEHVTFTGELGQSDLPKYFDNAHILLHTARFETGCAVIQEAMASGVAVCGTEVGILADIGERYALMVHPQDSEGLAEKIISLVNNPQLYYKYYHRSLSMDYPIRCSLVL